MMHTTFLPLIMFRILSKPAIDSAPAGSQMNPIEYSFMIFYASFRSDTSTKPSMQVRPMFTASSEVSFTEDPLQKRLTFSDAVSSPEMMDVE